MKINSICSTSTRTPFEHPLEHAYCWRIGIEVELENVRNYPEHWRDTRAGTKLIAGGWIRENDNSLRNNGVEFKFESPAAGRTVATRLSSLYGWIGASEWRASCRTGIHVHLDMRGLDIDAVTAILTTYALVEPYLFAYVGEDRESNIFTVPWYRSYTDAENWNTRVIRIVAQGAARATINRNISKAGCKYSALNYAALAKFGSLEFRHAPTWLDHGSTASWVGMLSELVRYAHTREATSIIDRWVAMGPRMFCRGVFGQHFDTIAEKVPSFVALADDSQCESIAEKVAGVCTYKATAWEPPLKEATTGSKHHYPFMRDSQNVPRGAFAIPNPARGRLRGDRPTRQPAVAAVNPFTTARGVMNQEVPTYIRNFDHIFDDDEGLEDQDEI